MATIITVPHLTRTEGISPNIFLTFSESNSISVLVRQTKIINVLFGEKNKTSC